MASAFCRLVPAALCLSLALGGCHDPHKKYVLDVPEVQNGDGERAAREAAPFADELVRYLRGQPRNDTDSRGNTGGSNESPNEFILRVEYAPGGFAPRIDSIGDLEALLVILRDFPSLNIAIEGHTDTEGEPEKNLKLSQWRADWVRSFLLERGIDPERVEAEGFGDSRPIATGDTPEAHEKNRRLVVRILNFDTQSAAR